MAYLGNIIQLLAAAGAVGVVFFFIARLQGKKYNPQEFDTPYKTIYALFGAISVASLILLYAFIAKDFSFDYVAANSSADMTVFQRVSAFWAGKGGSLLFWLWLLSGFTAGAAFVRRRYFDRLTSNALTILAAVQLFFLIILVFTDNNPFKVAALNLGVGQGINPLLLHWAMIFHPPTLFIGYAGMTVPFAYAMAALIIRDASHEWVDRAYKWTLFTWSLLSVGIFLGALWAYVVLGWGGYWGWDPVENASLLPWFAGVALLHSFHIYKQRKSFKHWALSMSILSFVMVIVATFITRSGIIQSVHAFEQNTTMVVVFSLFILAVVAGGVYLLATRWEIFESEEIFESLLSRDIAYHINNIVMVFATTVLLAGAFLPLITGQTVGPAVYNRIAQPLGVIFLLVIVICPLLAFGQTDPKRFGMRMAVPGGVTLAAAAPVYLYWNSLNKLITQVNPSAAPPANGWLGYIGLLVSVFGVVAVGEAVYLKIATRMKAADEGPLQAVVGFFRTQGGAAGGFITHLGLVIIVAGLVGSSMYVASVNKKIPEKKGQVMKAGPVSLTYTGLSTKKTSNRETFEAGLNVTESGKSLGSIAPRMVQYQLQGMTTREVDVIYEPFRDIFVIFNGQDEAGDLNFEIRINPLVSFVWVGSGLLVLGTAVAFWPRRRVASKR